MTTWWLIPLSKWVTTVVINGISGVSPLITGVTTHLLSGMNHQVVSSPNQSSTGVDRSHCSHMVSMIFPRKTSRRTSGISASHFGDATVDGYVDGTAVENPRLWNIDPQLWGNHGLSISSANWHKTRLGRTWLNR